jgi:hypothetical protein
MRAGAHNQQNKLDFCDEVNQPYVKYVAAGVEQKAAIWRAAMCKIRSSSVCWGWGRWWHQGYCYYQAVNK